MHLRCKERVCTQSTQLEALILAELSQFSQVTTACRKAHGLITFFFFKLHLTVLVRVLKMAQSVSTTQRAPITGKSLASYESVETHYDPGQPDVEVKASDNLSKTPLQPTTSLRRCPDYKPTALRWWFHGFLIICLAMFLGMTEYAMQTLLANNQEDLISQLRFKSVEDHNGDRIESPYHQHLVRVPSNATSSQTEAHSVNTGDPLAIGYSSSPSATGSILPIHTDHTPSSTWLSSSLFEPTDEVSFVPASTASATSNPYPLTTVGTHTYPTCTGLTWSTWTVSCSETSTTSVPYTIDPSDFLHLGTTTYTIFSQTSITPVIVVPTPSSQDRETEEGGYEITVPFLQSPTIGTDGTAAGESGSITTPSAMAPNAAPSAYLNLGHTTSTVTTIQTLTPSAENGGSLHLFATSSAMAEVIDPASQSATIPKAAELVSENAMRPDEKPMVTAIEQTEIWVPSETTLEMSSTDSDGKVGVEHNRTTYPGGTSVYQAAKTLPSEVHVESLTATRQSEAWSSIEVILEQTTTDSGGHISVQTVTTDVPAEPGFLESTVTVRPGESLVAVPLMITTTHGGLTQVMQTTYVDSEGRTTTSSYTTVIGGDTTLAMDTFFVATSLPAGYTVITVPTAIPTTEGGTVEVAQTVYTDAEGHLTTSLYTRTVHGTPTTRTKPVVIATPVSPGGKLVPTVISTMIGGTTEIIKTTSTDSRGQPTTFSYTTFEGGTPTSTTVWTIVPIPTSTTPTNSSGTQDTGDVAIYGLGLRDYILGAFLPTILAAIVAYPFKLIQINARLMQPFHELATAREADGVSAQASIFLRFYDWTGVLSLPRSVKLRQPIIVISDCLVLGAALLAPIAAETVSVHVPDGCKLGCYGRLTVTTIPGRVLEALIAAMMTLLVALIVLLNVFKWQTGVSHNPWGIAGIASLGLSPEIRNKIEKIPCHSSGSIKDSSILKALTGSKYALDEYWVSSSPGSVSSRGHGIVVRTSDDDAKQLMGSNEPMHGRTRGPRHSKEKKTQPFASLTWWGRCILLFIFTCVVIITTYYEASSLDSGFERFMDSRGFGVRFFFTALGVVIGGCMETFFRSVAIISPYHQLSKCALPAERSILLSPPTNAFYGIYSAIQQRSIFLGSVALATILAELFLPVTLSHVPFSHLDTYQTQRVCTWLSVSTLALMILVILYSFLIRWPHMPADPRTIAGAMFYVCDSWMLGTMEGMATLGKKERDSTVRSQRLRYEFASSKGVSGKERMNVDIRGEMGEAAVMIGEKVRYS